MILNVYISYGAAADQLIALRLQALAAVNGLQTYVPPAYTRDSKSSLLDDSLLTNLKRADVVLGVVTGSISDACKQELSSAKSLQKQTFVLASPTVEQQLQSFSPSNVIVMNPVDPAEAEAKIVQFVKKTQLTADSQTALMALGLIALGLLLFAPQE